jgi:DNA-binding winged helix-turn-helix (wHTH) protein/Flp pilus assembly protein TadD
MDTSNRFVVGDWEVHPDANELRHGAKCVKLESRVMSLLEFLHSNRDRVVGRDELVTEVWGKRYLTDHSISVAIAALRQALGDKASEPRYIKTVYKKGYRLIAPVGEQNRARRFDFREDFISNRYAIAAVFMAITLLAIGSLISFNADEVPLIVVKDFVNETGDSRDDELAVVLTDLVVAELARDRRARVQKQVPRRLLLPLDSFEFQNAHAATVTGRLLQDGAETHLSVYLEDGESSEIIWSSGRLVDRSNSLATARTVSKNMLFSMIPADAPTVAAPLTGDELRLDEMYQLALNLAGIRSHATSKAAHGVLQEALELNPDYGPAHSLLAYLYTLEAPEYWGLDGFRFKNAETELMLAREFGSNEAHNLATDALLSSTRDGRPDEAKRLMDKANLLAPDDPWVLRQNFTTDIIMKDIDAALQRNMKAARLSVDPSSILAERIAPLYFGGRYEEAVELYEATRELDLLPVYQGPQAAVLAGDQEKGFLLWIDMLEAHDLAIDEPSIPLQQIASGNVEFAYEWLAAQLPANSTSKNAALLQASWLITSGRKNEAMEVLLAGARRNFGVAGKASVPTFLWAVVQHDPIFAELKDDPRMNEVLDLVGVVPLVRIAIRQNRVGGTMPARATASD